MTVQHQLFMVEKMEMLLSLLLFLMLLKEEQYYLV
jgi:hypothetical protein